MCDLELISWSEYGVMLLLFPDFFSHCPFFLISPYAEHKSFLLGSQTEKKINQEVTSPN